MTKRMLIDASHAEETRVVVLDGNRLEEFDLEAATRKPLKGNIYLAKVVRVEPSLQAAFVEYGGNRHGFLAFSEIHPDYYQIPVADRQRLLQMQAEEAREADEAEEDPLPESPMDRAAEEEIGARGRDGDGEGQDAAASGEAEGQDAATPSEGNSPSAATAREADGQDAATVREAEGGDAATASEADAPSATPESQDASAASAPDAPEPAMPEVASGATAAAPDTQPAAPAAAEAPALPAMEAEPPPAIASATAADSETGADAPAPGTEPAMALAPSGDAEAAGAGEAEAPEGPLAGEADADSAELLVAEMLEGEILPVEEESQPPRRSQGEARHARRRDGRGRGRRDDRQREESRATPEGEEDRDGEEEAPPETIGGEGPEEGDNGREERRIPPRFLRHYKIQEVIKRRQIMLVQVVKEERGTKGAALTTYISLAGRFSVLMPNSPRGGGVSRKITSAQDRKRLREAIDELGLPDGMSLIVRTAGAQRPKPEIKKDCEYLLRLWDNIRERTLASTAPALIYEEADLIKRAIRDVFSRDVEEIVVEGEDAYQEARDFMRMLMPQHVKKIQYAREGGLFARAQVEQQLDAMHSPTVQLKSGGYIVINQTEALVAIDVNSGRATRERHIEDTALRTNLEASDEIARQLRLRDLAGLIVIDFIDMESSKHDGMVERRLKEALRHDRARIQVGRISHFGLLEMSRQRLRPSLAETSFVTCPHCQGRGTVRSIESSALAVLRAIEDEGAKRRAAEIAVHCCSTVALYLLNRKRDRLTQLEEHFGMAVLFEPDESLAGPQHRIERLRAAEPRALPPAPQAALRMDYAPEPEEEAEDAEDEAEAGAEEENEPAVAREGETQAEAEARAEAEGGKRRRRRRRRRGPRPEGAAGAEAAAGSEAGDDGSEDGEEDSAEEEVAATPEGVEDTTAEAAPIAEGDEEPGAPQPEESGESRAPRRRRGRRGASQRPEAAPGAEAPRHETPRQVPVTPAAPPRYMGPTPADPFAGHVDDILAAMEAAEAAAEAAAASRQGRMSAAPTPVAAAAPEIEPIEPAPVAADRDPAPDATALEPVLAEAAPAPEEPVSSAPTMAAEPAVAEPATTVGVAPEAASPEVGTPAEPSAANGSAAAPAAEPPGDETAEAPRQAPPIQPQVIGEAAIAAPRRGGWWRRSAS